MGEEEVQIMDVVALNMVGVGVQTTAEEAQTMVVTEAQNTVAGEALNTGTVVTIGRAVEAEIATKQTNIIFTDYCYEVPNSCVLTC